MNGAFQYTFQCHFQYHFSNMQQAIDSFWLPSSRLQNHKLCISQLLNFFNPLDQHTWILEWTWMFDDAFGNSKLSEILLPISYTRYLIYTVHKQSRKQFLILPLQILYPKWRVYILFLLSNTFKLCPFIKPNHFNQDQWNNYRLYDILKLCQFS